MARKNVADLLVDVLAETGVSRIYGVSGDSLNGITDSIRISKRIQWIHVRHEETAAFAAGAEAHLTGRLAVCAGSCGPGNLHLINEPYDCHRSRVPVLAIAAQVPSNEIGSGYFQETHPEHLFAQCSHYCELVSQSEQMPRVLEIAIQTAISRRGVAVVTLPGDIGFREAAVTRVDRTVEMTPNEAYAGPVYGPPVIHRVSREATFVFDFPAADGNTQRESSIKASGSTALFREDFPQLVRTVVSTYWPPVVEDENCQVPDANEAYSDSECTGTYLSVHGLPEAPHATNGEDPPGPPNFNALVGNHLTFSFTCA